MPVYPAPFLPFLRTPRPECRRVLMTPLLETIRGNRVRSRAFEMRHSPTGHPEPSRCLSLRPDRESRAPATADQTPSGRPEPQLSTAHKQGTHLWAPHPPVSIVRSEPSARIPACPSTFGPRPEPEDASRCERVRKRLRSREPVDTFNSVPAFDASILQKSRKASCLLQVLHWIPFLSRSPRNPKNGTSSGRPP